MTKGSVGLHLGLETKKKKADAKESETGNGL